MSVGKLDGSSVANTSDGVGSVDAWPDDVLGSLEW
jgi:hypothetical protein